MDNKPIDPDLGASIVRAFIGKRITTAGVTGSSLELTLDGNYKVIITGDFKLYLPKE